MAPSPPSNLGAPETERMSPTDGLDAARGFVVGMIIGLAFWIAVLILAYAVMVLA